MKFFAYMLMAITHLVAGVVIAFGSQDYTFATAQLIGGMGYVVMYLFLEA